MKRLKKIIVAFVFFISFCSVSFAETVEYDILDGQLIFDTATGTITGYTGSPVIVSIPETIEGTNVTSIGSYAFYGCSSLMSVKIPKSVTQIGDCAFGMCEKLSEIDVSEDNMYFSDSSGVLYNKSKTVLIQYPSGKTDIKFDIPSGVVTVSSWAFSGSGIRSISISASVSEIGSEAFASCVGLSEISVDAANKNYSSNDGVLYSKDSSTLILYPCGKTDASFSVPSTVKIIGNEAFENAAISSVSLPSGLTEIGDWAFSGSSILSINLPSSISSIGTGAFSHCANLTSINVSSANAYYSSDSGILYNKDKTILIQYPAGKKDFSFSVPESVSTIGEGAFAGNPNITSLNFSKNLSVIGDYAFMFCSSLEKIEVSEDNSYFSASDGVLYSKDKTELILYPPGKSSGSFTVPQGVSTIMNGAFYCSTNLLNVTLPDTLTAIGNLAFGSCEALTDISLPESVIYISDYAFMYCSALENAYFYGNAPSLGEDVFYGCSDEFAIYYFEGCEGYSGSGWDDYKVEPFATIESGDGIIKLSVNEGQVLGYSGSPTELVLPESAKSIKSNAFSGCDSLKNVFLPASIESIGSWAFSFCESLTAINVDKNNKYYTSIDGVLYTKDKKTLIQYPSGKTDTEFHIPDGIQILGDDSVSYCASLKSVYVPESVVSIGNWAFADCTYLNSIYFYGNAPELGESVFANTAIDLIIYRLPSSTGFTQPDWNKFSQLTFLDDRNIVITESTDKSVTVKIYNTENYDIDSAFVFVVTYCENGCIASVSHTKASIKSGETATLQLEIEVPSDAVLIKAFLWNDRVMPIFKNYQKFL